MHVKPQITLDEMDTRALVNLLHVLGSKIKENIQTQSGPVTPDEFLKTQIEIAQTYVNQIAVNAFHAGIDWQKKQ